jgi:hypothetical protein
MVSSGGTGGNTKRSFTYAENRKQTKLPWLEGKFLPKLLILKVEVKGSGIMGFVNRFVYYR